MLIVDIYNGDSHLFVVALQCLDKRMLACAVGFAYASFYKVAVNGVTKSLFCNIDKDGRCWFLLLLRLFNEYCTQRKRCDRSAIGIYLLNDSLAFQVLL